jgi:hypothetical protein
MRSQKFRWGLVGAATFCCLAAYAPAGTVNLQLRPATTSVCQIGGNVDIQLWALSANFCANAVDQSCDDQVAAIQAILNWDPTHLSLVGLVNSSSYSWAAQFFPDDRELDRLNHDRAGGLFWSEQACTSNSQCQAPGVCPAATPCSSDFDCRSDTYCNFSLNCGALHCCNTRFCTFTGLPLNDGNAKANWWAAPTDPPGPFVVDGNTMTGTLVGTIRFQVISGGSSQVQIVASGGPLSPTAVYDGAQPNLNVFGQVLTPHPTVSVLNPSIPNPTVTVVGSKYLRVQPGAGAPQLALRVRGVSGTPSACIDGYIQTDGSITSTPVYRTGTQWGTIFTKDTELVPGLRYTVASECGTTSSSSPQMQLWRYGDVNNDLQTELYDVLYILEGYRGVFTNASFYACDLGPCGAVPPAQRIIDVTDVIEVLTAYSGAPYTQFCPAACP